MGRHRAVVDDSPASGRLGLHDAHHLAGHEEGPCEVGIDNDLPLNDPEFLERDSPGTDAGMVEQQIKS